MTDGPLRDRLRALPEPDWEFWADDGSFAVEPTDEADLITLATDRALLDAQEGSHDYWVPVHAWRASCSRSHARRSSCHRPIGSTSC